MCYSSYSSWSLVFNTKFVNDLVLFIVFSRSKKTRSNDHSLILDCRVVRVGYSGTGNRPWVYILWSVNLYMWGFSGEADLNGWLHKHQGWNPVLLRARNVAPSIWSTGYLRILSSLAAPQPHGSSRNHADLLVAQAFAFVEIVEWTIWEWNIPTLLLLCRASWPAGGSTAKGSQSELKAWVIVFGKYGMNRM